jgi:hypothetical protein
MAYLQSGNAVFRAEQSNEFILAAASRPESLY